MTRRQFCWTLGGAATLALLPGVPAHGTESSLHAVERSGRAFGTEVQIRLWHAEEAVAQQALQAMFDELEQIERVMSLYRPDSEIVRLNRTSSLDAPHPYLRQVLQTAARISQETDGAFDISVQPLWELYARCREAGRLPRQDEIAQARRLVDWRKVHLSQEQVELKREGMSITLNGIAQGFAGDRVLEALRGHGIQHAFINTGEVSTLGDDPTDGRWEVGIQHPRVRDAYIALAEPSGGCLATSGDYATTFSDDYRAHHIFDPSTGTSAGKFSSVTLLAPTGIEADALSTGLFVLGPDHSLEFLKSRPHIEAFFVLKDGQVVATEGFPLQA